MPSRKLKEFLDSEGIKYVKITHSPAYTAQEIAASAHIKGKEFAKTIIVFVDGTMSMAVLPAHLTVDFDYFRKSIAAKRIELAAESEFKDNFPDCEIGAMPPFGNLYGLKVYVDQSLSKNEDISFNAGLHCEIFKLSFKDFEKLVEPEIVKLS
ncbi:MAG: YbaK/EbsC family protein [Syntrophales bacterium]|jgi:Ala-tRNA(Pro) deacylase|nr:YbaK/EbsC family protein [Syntrophales bacterium]MDY0044885.1 YbaK/EbsC family protein [Syntrophales bacterium]